MNPTDRRRWLGAAILAGLLYLAFGVISSALAASAGSSRMVRTWRWTAFLLSGLVFVIHIAQESIRLGATSRRTAWRASVAVALGAFALALWANVHDLVSASGYRPRMLIALVAWPVVTAVPAFLVALVLGSRLARTRSRA